MLLDQVPKTALAIYAHPDDADVSCGGTLAYWAKQGAATHLIVVTTGDKGGQDASVPTATLVEARAAEVEQSSKALGLTSFQKLGIPDGELTNTNELRERLVEAVRTLRPDVVLFPDPTALFFGDTYVNHRDHRELGYAMLDVVAPAAASARYFPGTGEPHAVGTALLSGTEQPDCWVDISSAIEAKIAAVDCHRSMLGDSLDSVNEVVRHRAESEGRDAGVPLAEAFRRLRLGV